MYSETEKSKCQDLPKFQFFGGGILKLKSQSAKICLNFNFFGGGGILKLKSQSAKIPRSLPKFKFWGGILKLKSQSAKICLNFNFQVGYCQDLPKFQFLGGGVF